MQLPVVMNAIEALIQARPSTAPPATPISALTTPISSSTGSVYSSSSSTSSTMEGGRGGKGGEEEVDARKTLPLNRTTRSARWNKQLSLRRSK